MKKQAWGVLFAALFCLGTRGALPKAAGGAAWLCPLLAGAAVLLLGLLLQKRGGRPKPGPVGSVLALLWAVVLLTAQTGEVGERLAQSLGASSRLAGGLALALAALLVSRGGEAFGRGAALFALAVGVAFGGVVLFALFGVEWGNVLLWTHRELAAVPEGSGSLLLRLAPGLYLLFLPGEDWDGGWKGRLALLFSLLSLAWLLTLGRLGAALAGETKGPFLQMVASLGWEGAFQRLEPLVDAIWLLGDVTFLGLLLLACQQLLAGVWVPFRGQTFLLATVPFLLSLTITNWRTALVGAILQWGNGIFLVLMVLWVLRGRGVSAGGRLSGSGSP